MISRLLLIVLLGGALVLLALHASALRPGGSSALARSDSPLPDDLPAGVRDRLERLGAPGWSRREEAARWLLDNRDLWWARIPEDWQPQGPEARWRWRWVHRKATELRELPGVLGSLPADEARMHVLTLYREIGATLLPAFTAVWSHRDPRVRQRGIEALDEIPGLELPEILRPLETDPSAAVRRALYSLAARRDPAWAQGLVERALERDEGPTLRTEVIRGIRALGRDEFVDRLRSEWDAAPRVVREQIALYLADLGERRDRAVFHWMVRSEEYPVVMAGLRVLCRIADEDDLRRLIGPFETSPFYEVRSRLVPVLRERGGPSLALDVLHLIDSPDAEMARTAAGWILAWGAEDFYGDLFHAERDRGERLERTVPLIYPEGSAKPVPAPHQEEPGEEEPDSGPSGRSSPVPRSDPVPADTGLRPWPGEPVEARLSRGTARLEEAGRVPARRQR